LHHKERAFSIQNVKEGERKVEYPWVFERLIESGRFVDIGCLETNFTEEVAKKASLEVYGIDIRVPRERRTYNFVRCDVRYLPFRENVFDEITAISTIEHVGLLGYGNSLLDSEGDRKALNQIMRVAKEQGAILLTLPFGEKPPFWYRTYAILKYKNVEGWMRIYNLKRLWSLLQGLGIEDLDFFAQKSQSWIKASQSEAEKARGKMTPFPGSVVCVKIRK
jgi:ubiquinone/menaquinone biosynthesis C-methylase UbiE